MDDFGGMPTIIRFTKAEADEAIAAGDKRWQFARNRNARNYGIDLSPEECKENHHVGSIGEWVCAEYFGLEFEGGTDFDSYESLVAPDLKIIEVRARRIQFGLNADLTIRPDDKMRLPVVLVRVSMERMLAEIVGWLCGWEAIEREDKIWYGPRQVFYVPPPYHSVLSLVQWLACGRRPHWCPEKYRSVA
jgi:hypothetical protein